MKNFDITAGINGHSEGLLAHTSLVSLAKAVNAARVKGLRVEVLAIIDRPTSVTREVFDHHSRKMDALRIVEVDYGDLGHSRNTAVELANGKWTSFLDADDLWGENWLSSAFACAESDPRKIAWHPQTNLYFGTASNVFLHLDMEDPRFHIANLAATNPWTALCFASTKVFREIPYRESKHEEYVGYEDWSWNIDVVHNGGLHKVVPNTAHAIRSRSHSLVKRTAAAGCIPAPSDAFRDLLAHSFETD